MSPSRTGFVVSVLFHTVLVGLGLYLWLKPTPQPDDSKDVVVPVALAAFAPPAPKPIPEPPQEPPTVQPPAPEIKPLVEAPPAAMPEEESKPEPKPEPKPERKLEPAPKKPEPKPIHRPTPPRTAEPKTQTAQKAPQPPSKAPSAVQPTTTDRAPEKPTEAVPQQIKTPTGLTPSERERLTLSYQTALAEAIEREKFYPALARRLNQQGIIRVGFTVLADGRITNIHLLEPSAATALNQGAIEAIKRVGQFKPIPSELGMSSMEFSIGLIYKLR